MLYIFMLGYDVDFGHMEAVSLISAPKYPEKQVDNTYLFLNSLDVCWFLIFYYVIRAGWIFSDVMFA